MDKDEIRYHAERLIQLWNDHYEYDFIYEDELLEEADESDWRAIHKEMFNAKLTVSWED